MCSDQASITSFMFVTMYSNQARCAARRAFVVLNENASDEPDLVAESAGYELPRPTP